MRLFLCGGGCGVFCGWVVGVCLWCVLWWVFLCGVVGVVSEAKRSLELVSGTGLLN